MKKRSPRDQDVHVFWHRPTGGGARWHGAWRVERRGFTWALWPTQRRAIVSGIKVAKAFRCELVVHGRDGRIRRKDSFGHDPRRRKG